MCDFSKATQKKNLRYHWFCKKCGRDFSFEYILWYEVAHPEIVRGYSASADIEPQTDDYKIPEADRNNF